MSEWLNAVCDWVQSNLGWAVAIVSSGAFTGFLMNFLFGIWRIKIQKKATQSANEKVIEKYNQLETKVDALIEKIDNYEKNSQKNAEATKEEFANLVGQYQKSKQAFLNAVIETNKETQEIINEAKEVVKEIEEVEQPEEQENDIVLPNEPIIYEEFAEQEVEQPKEQDEEYILVEKTYGE